MTHLQAYQTLLKGVSHMQSETVQSVSISAESVSISVESVSNSWPINSFLMQDGARRVKTSCFYLFTYQHDFLGQMKCSELK